MPERFLLTAAQSNTKVVPAVWRNVLALAKHWDARLMVGTYTYNKAGIGARGAKRKTSKEMDDTPEWWDTAIEPYIADKKEALAPGLDWCGEMQILPTAVSPLSGMEGYTGRRSSIFPHAKVAMSSVPSGASELTKLMFTTGAVTGENYIQKKAGLKAQFHHSLGCLVVEVDNDGGWWVRQISADKRGTLYDLDTVVRGGKVLRNTKGVAGIVWGDIHVATIDPVVKETCWGEGGMIDALKPKHQFFHDLFDNRVGQNHEVRKGNHHRIYATRMAGHWKVGDEIADVARFLKYAKRSGCQSVVVHSNHDAMLTEWLRQTDHKKDPLNAEFYLEAELYMHRQLRGFPNDDPPILEWAVHRAAGLPKAPLAEFLSEDERFILCPDANGGIECGMHGHRGPNGARGTIRNIARMGRKSVIGHSHTAGIFEGCYQVGLSGLMDQGYNKGPSSWTHTHCVIYPNGKRSLITLHDGKWRA